MKKITNIKDCYDGMMVTCTIEGSPVDEARLRVSHEEFFVFICQNVHNGDKIGSRFYFDYSWVVGVHRITGVLLLSEYNISNLEKHPDSDKLILNK